MKTIIVILLALFFTETSWAKYRGISQLLLWKPDASSPAQILPQRKGETPKEAVKRYLQTLTLHPDLKRLFNKTRFNLAKISFEQIKVLDSKKIRFTARPKFLLISNQLNDLAPHYFRPPTIIKPLEHFGAEVYMLAPAAEVGLNPKEAKEFRSQLVDLFDALMALGGDDVHPKVYNRSLTNSYPDQINYARDMAEIRLIKAFNKKQQGVFYGICRGSQLCAVAEGATLIQDLKKEQKIVKEHWMATHPIQFSPTNNNLLRLLLHKDEIESLSIHHQAITPHTGNIVPIAFYGEGSQLVIEAWQLPNMLGFGVQFHPELLDDNPDNVQLLKAMVQFAGHIKELKMKKGLNCQNILASLL